MLGFLPFLWVCIVQNSHYSYNRVLFLPSMLSIGIRVFLDKIWIFKSWWCGKKQDFIFKKFYMNNKTIISTLFYYKISCSILQGRNNMDVLNLKIWGFLCSGTYRFFSHRHKSVTFQYWLSNLDSTQTQEL